MIKVLVSDVVESFNFRGDDGSDISFKRQQCFLVGADGFQYRFFRSINEGSPVIQKGHYELVPAFSVLKDKLKFSYELVPVKAA